MSWSLDLQQTVSAVAERVGPALVRVGHGAGVIVAPDRVATNAHNVRGAEPHVDFGDRERVVGAVAGFDLDGDLAVLDVATGERPAVDWADGSQLGVGSAVLALARSREGVRVTLGFVSATAEAFRGPRGRLITDAFEHTAPLARGSSGGPVVGPDGSLVGINTHRRPGGFYVALPATDRLRDRIDALGRGEAPQRPRLGIAVAPSHVARRLRSAVGLEDRPGLLVRDVDRDGPAARAGIRRGDLLVRAGGPDVTDADALFDTLDGLSDSTALEVDVVRGTDELTMVVTFGDTHGDQRTRDA